MRNCWPNLTLDLSKRPFWLLAFFFWNFINLPVWYGYVGWGQPQGRLQGARQISGRQIRLRHHGGQVGRQSSSSSHTGIVLQWYRYWYRYPMGEASRLVSRASSRYIRGRAASRRAGLQCARVPSPFWAGGRIGPALPTCQLRVELEKLLLCVLILIAGVKISINSC